MHTLDISYFSEANKKRLVSFKNSKGEPANSLEWGLWDWYGALVGEIGEYANFKKKLVRGDINQEEFQEKAGKELADIQTYVSIFANFMEIKLSSRRWGQSLYTGEKISSIFTIGNHGLDMEAMASYCDKQALRHLNANLEALLDFVLGRTFTYSGETSLQTKDQQIEDILSNKFRDLQYSLEVLAYKNGIDLALETFNKFNEVSERTGSTVKLSKAALQKIYL